MLLVHRRSGQTRRCSSGVKATVAAYFSPTAAAASRISTSVESGVNRAAGDGPEGGGEAHGEDLPVRGFGVQDVGEQA